MRKISEIPLFSIIVVNHNRAALLRNCLASLLRQTVADLEVLVVDNGSSDGSLELCRSLKDRRVHLIALDSNLGFSQACNVGFARSRGEFLALINNDAEAAPGWLEALWSPMREDSSVGMCASKIYFYGTPVIDKAGHLIYWDGQNRGRGTGEVDCGQFDRMEESLFPDGCGALYRRRAVEEVRGFDPDFFAYADDADLGFRIRLMGWKSLYVPAAVVYHHHSATTSSYSTQKIYWIERNRLWLAVKCLPLPLLLLAPATTLYRWLWNGLALLAGRGAASNFARKGSRVLLARTILRASLDGVRGAPAMYGKRRELRRSRVLSDWEAIRLMWRFRISARQLSFQDRRPDRPTGES